MRTYPKVTSLSAHMIVTLLPEKPRLAVNKVSMMWLGLI